MLKERYTLQELETELQAKPMADEPTFAIKRKYILGLGRWLAGLSLSGRESRERTKFVDTLSAEVRENEATRLEVLKKFAELDPDTKEPMLKKNEVDGSEHYVIPPEKLEDFTKEIQTYLEEDFVMSGPGNRQRLKNVKNIVLETQEKISPEIAPEYDVWCDAFEKVEA